MSNGFDPNDVGGSTPKMGAFFDSPLTLKGKTTTPGNLFSTLGEYRSPADSSFWLNHGATDFVAGKGRAVYSPDTGRVRFGESSNKNSGKPPVKIGRFAFLHFANVEKLNVNPKELGNPNIWTWVVEPRDEIFVVRKRKPKATTLKKLKKEVVKGVRKRPDGTFEPVFWYSRRLPIGFAGPQPDLHVIYYAHPATSYGATGQIRNLLGVVRYKNNEKPDIQVVRFYSQKPLAGKKAKVRILDTSNKREGNLDIAQHGGVDIVVTCSSFKRGDGGRTRAGIYKLAYSIDRFVSAEEAEVLEGAEPFGRKGKRFIVPAVAESVMFTYDRMPDKPVDRNLVARNNRYPLAGSQNNVSAFTLTQGNQTKFSAFVVTNSDGDDRKHWALEDTKTYPDGNYLLTIRAWNIAKSNGVDKQPGLNMRLKRFVVRVKTKAKGTKRKLTISKA